MRARPILCLVIAALALTGCVPEPVAPTPAPTASATDAPIFASEEEALAAAEAAYAEYEALAAVIGADGGNDPRRIEDVATGELAEIDIEGFEALIEAGYYTSGSSVARDFNLQSYDAGSEKGVVSAYVCSDVSGITFHNSAGEVLDTNGRPTELPLLLSFDWVDESLKVASRDTWDGDGVC